MPLMETEELRRYLEFYQDLGIRDLYRRPRAAVKETAAALFPAIASKPPRAPVLRKSSRRPIPLQFEIVMILNVSSKCTEVI